MRIGSNGSKNKDNVCHQVSFNFQSPVIQLELHATPEMHLMSSLNKPMDEAQDI